MNRPEGERARAFRAAADLAAVRALEASGDVRDEIVGFHAQQCAEKLLKAVLAANAVEFPRTHSLRFLLDLLSDHGLPPLAPLHVVEQPWGERLAIERRRSD
jgi:HEPN domain-containing protein